MDQKELFENSKISKAYFKLAIPVVLGMVVSLVYNMVDTYFIALTGDTNLVAGVSLCAPIFTLMIALGDILGLGGSSVISRLLGQKREDKVKNISAFCFYGAILIGLCITAILLVFRNSIVIFLGASAETMPHVIGYYTYIAIGAPFIILTFSPCNQLRCEGMAKESMIASVLGTVVNIILDPIFILALKMGAKGAAIATVIGNISTIIYCIYLYERKSQFLTLRLKYLKVELKDIKDVFEIGFPASITNLMQSFALMMTNRSLLQYGNDKIAAFGVANKITMIAILVMVGFAFGGQPLYGYNYGAKNYKRFKESTGFGYKFIISLGAAMTVILALLGSGMIAIFGLGSEVTAIGANILRIQLIGMIFMGTTLQSTCIFQSTGNAIEAFVLSFFRQGLLFGICILILQKAFGYYGILFAQPVSDILTAMIAIVFYRRMIVNLEG